MSILDKIIAHKKEEVAVIKNNLWKEQDDKIKYISQIQKSEISFYNALINKERVWPLLIAEVKKGSPSQGLIRDDFNVAEIVKLYDQYADTMSILTDEKFFLGSLENLKIARQNTNKPLLRKDFIIDEFQIYEARQAGANAILLLASVLDTEKIQEFLDLTHSLGMDALVEVHTEEELQNILKTNAKIIGINNRNLKDFSIDLDTSNRLAALIPEDKIIVSESGLQSKHDIRQVRKNVDAMLIGTAITKAKNMTHKIRSLVGIPEVKICGITNLEDAQKAIEYGADYLGFIFHEPSPRYISPNECANILKQLQTTNYLLSTKAVGVFVNKNFEQVLGIVKECNLDVVQLHGDEDEIIISKLRDACKKDVEIWKAIRIKSSSDLTQVNEFQAVDGILLDTYQKDNYGGTGEAFDWNLLEDFNPSQKVILAGGIDAKNLPEAIKLYHPDTVDLSSRIEEKPGKKDLVKMKELFNAIL